jgi:hypothetical protein
MKPNAKIIDLSGSQKPIKPNLGLKLKPGWDWEFSGSSNCIIRIGLLPTELIEEVNSRLSSLK